MMVFKPTYRWISDLITKVIDLFQAFVVHFMSMIDDLLSELIKKPQPKTYDESMKNMTEALVVMKTVKQKKLTGKWKTSWTIDWMYFIDNWCEGIQERVGEA